MYLTDPYQYSDYPPPYNYKPDPYGAKASSATAHGMSAAVAGPMDYSAYGSGHSACAYPGAMGSAYLGPHPGAYSYDDLAAAARFFGPWVLTAAAISGSDSALSTAV